MKFTLDKSSLETFNKDRIIELEGFYSPEKIVDINREIDSLLAKEKVELREDAMKLGHNLFLQMPNYKRLFQLPLLAEIVYELISVKPLRLAYDQLLVAAADTFDQNSATSFLTPELTLEKRSSVNELVMGVMIALNAKEAMIPFSGEPGRVVFFSPETSIPFDFLKDRLADRYLLLAFSSAHAQYLYNDLDPQNHYLKKMGYVYGDKLKDSVSPIVFR